MTQAANLAALGTNAGTTGILPAAGGGTAGTAGVTGFKNRFINGNMVLDQRNNGASVSTASATSGYTVDRWQFANSQLSKLSYQQNSGSVTPPAGFTNYLGAVSASAYSIVTDDYFTINQKIEGYNVADLGWGTSSAKTITVSFWVRSSLTGTFGAVLNNSDNTRAYPFTYTISAANTWEYKTTTIAGDSSGTWGTTSGTGIQLRFGLGVGATYSGTAGAWTGTANVLGATGGTSVVGTNGATFYITGVQFEQGTAATNFDVRSYTTELQLCQRYFWRTTGVSGAGYTGMGAGGFIDSTSFSAFVPYPVTMRATPTFTQAQLQITTSGYPSVSSIGQNYSSQYAGRLDLTTSSSSAGYGGVLGAGSTTTSSYLTASAEL
jgi:hypothetical protein